MFPGFQNSADAAEAASPRHVPICISENTEGPVVIRIKGGILEVSQIRATERFEASNDETILGVPIGKTITRIRVPAVYRYHVVLAEEWKVLLKHKRFIVISPPLQPSLPVAIDTKKLQAEASGRWSPLTGEGRIAELKRYITMSLNAKVATPSFIQFQREAARQTLKEFVAKWLVTPRSNGSLRRRTPFTCSSPTNPFSR